MLKILLGSSIYSVNSDKASSWSLCPLSPLVFAKATPVLLRVCHWKRPPTVAVSAIAAAATVGKRRQRSLAIFVIPVTRFLFLPLPFLSFFLLLSHFFSLFNSLSPFPLSYSLSLPLAHIRVHIFSLSLPFSLSFSILFSRSFFHIQTLFLS